MRKVVLFEEIGDIAKLVNNEAFDLMEALKTESFEAHEGFDLLAFDWYDVHSERTENSKMVIYLDDKNLFFLCEDKPAFDCADKIFGELGEMSNEQFLYAFFVRLLKGDMNYLDKVEEQMSDVESEILSGAKKNALEKIIKWRKELLRLKRYYEQLDVIFDEMNANDNKLLSHLSVGRAAILGSRTDRYLGTVQILMDIVGQLCDAYQSQLSIEQNDFMKVFTIITSIFLPLTLITGWYGMNFQFMPALHWKYGYPCVIAVSIAISVLMLLYFKKKKWI